MEIRKQTLINALPVLNFDRARLDSVELLPFREAIDAGVGGVMIGHLHVPSLRKNQPLYLRTVISCGTCE